VPALAIATAQIKTVIPVVMPKTAWKLRILPRTGVHRSSSAGMQRLTPMHGIVRHVCPIYRSSTG
jgi:hypothetical protein